MSTECAEKIAAQAGEIFDLRAQLTTARERIQELERQLGAALDSETMWTNHARSLRSSLEAARADRDSAVGMLRTCSWAAYPHVAAWVKEYDARVAAEASLPASVSAPTRTCCGEMRDAALANAAMVAWDMGHPDVRLAINRLIPDGSPAIPIDDERNSGAATPIRPAPGAAQGVTLEAVLAVKCPQCGASNSPGTLPEGCFGVGAASRPFVHLLRITAATTGQTR